MTHVLLLLAAAMLGVSAPVSVPPPEPRPATRVIEWTADWCGPCKQMQPAVDKLRAEGYAIQAVNADKNAAFVKSRGVTGLPTIVVYRRGKNSNYTELGRLAGPATYEQIKSLLKLHNVLPGRQGIVK